MILRRIKAHIEKENWFAVGIDFCIVVIGVFVGIQVANWNNVQQERVSEAQYLERFVDDLEVTIAHIQSERAFSQTSIEAIDDFATKLFQNDTSDADLVAATKGYLTTGAFFANFRPNRTTFDDLITTGNFDIIGDEDIRTGLIRLHARFDAAHDTIQSNIAWIQQGEDRIYYEFDAFRYDKRTQPLFDEVAAARLAEDIRNSGDLLRRHSAFHYWLKDRSIELYDDIEPQAQAVLDLIRSEQGRTRKSGP